MAGKMDVVRTEHGKALAIICLVLQLLAFVFSTVATPVTAFKRSEEPLRYLTLWGPSRKYSKLDLIVNYTMRGVGCENPKVMITISASFSILAAICTLASAICTILSLAGCCNNSGGYCVPGVLGISAWIILVVDWAVLIAAFYYKCTDELTGLKLPTLKEQGYQLDAAPALIIVAWCLESIFVVIIFCI